MNNAHKSHDAMLKLGEQLLLCSGKSWHLYKYTTDVITDPLEVEWGDKITTIQELRSYLRGRFEKYNKNYDFKFFISVGQIGAYEACGLETFVVSFDEGSNQYHISSDEDMCSFSLSFEKYVEVGKIMDMHLSESESDRYPCFSS